MPAPRRIRPQRLRSIAGMILATGLLLLSTGCATYSAKLVDLRPELAEGKYDEALATVAEGTGGKDRLLNHLERGLILHFADRWTESNEAFADAELLADDLYTKSISEGVLSLVTSDANNAYRARPFEMAMVPYYKALNYIYLGQRNEAQVEARRSSEMLARYTEATLDALRDEDRGALEQIRNNAFMLYFAGMLYDWDGAWNDAFVSYRNAAAAFEANGAALDLEIPPSLATDLVRVGRRLGFYTQLEEIRRDCPSVFALRSDEDDERPATPEEYEAAAAWKTGHGEVALLLEEGFVPQKVQTRFDLPIFEGEAYDDPDYWAWEFYGGMGEIQALSAGRSVEYWVSVALPEMQAESRTIAGARVSAGIAGSHVLTAQVENLNSAALITFEAEQPMIVFRTFVRGLTKYLATRGVEKKGGKLAGLAANLFGAAMEKADTRSWLTLPRGVHLARLHLPAGVYDLEIQLLDERGRTLESRIVPGVNVHAGDWTFVSQRVF